jgi:ABC-type Zn uptake system ZnuABC Zn-binding protein ZnuA
MKRLYSLMLALIMIFALCACGASANSMKTEAAPAEPMMAPAAADMAYTMNSVGGFGMAGEATEA